MILIKKKPITNSLRNQLHLKPDEITYKGKSMKSLTKGNHKSCGIDNKGHKSVKHKARGNKKLYRQIQFKRPLDVSGEIIRCEHNPNSSALIDLIKYENGSYGYVLHTYKTYVGDKIIASTTSIIKDGNSNILKNIPQGQMVHSIELNENQGARLIRSAGGYAIVLAQEEKFTKIVMPSKEVRLINNKCWCVIGQIGNIEHHNRKLGSAGRAYKLHGRRPHVRGTAMSAYAHPHGGGEGRSPIGRKFILDKHGNVKGRITRSRNKYNNKLIISKSRLNKKIKK